MDKFRQKNGSVLVFSLLALAILLIVALGIVRVTAIGQLGAGTTDDSAVAFQAADSGAEHVFYKLLKEAVPTLGAVGPCAGGVVSRTIDGGGSYSVEFFDETGDRLEQCSDSTTLVRSAKVTGFYGKAVRAIQVSVSMFAEVSDGLSAHWPFDEGAGNLVDDTAGASNDHNGFADSPTWTTAALRGTHALVFDGINDKITVQNESDFAFSASDDFTFSLWAKPAEVSGLDTLLSKSMDVSPGYALYRDGSAWRAIIGGNSISGGSAAADNWYHISLRKNGSGVALYVNGVSVATGSAGNLDGSGKFYIGESKGVSPAAGNWRGVIDDVRIYNRALSDEEILTLCRQRRDGGTCG
ncbi:MAG TPA: LamG domain-containing protein [Candidatus Moranbacteria bacterium]|nr:LamG domain-containing protein [Candidatus Moranbacteria bacterium]